MSFKINMTKKRILTEEEKNEIIRIRKENRFMLK